MSMGGCRTVGAMAATVDDTEHSGSGHARNYASSGWTVHHNSHHGLSSDEGDKYGEVFGGE